MFSHRERLNHPCPKCNGFAWGVGTATTVSGSIIHPYYCTCCGEKTNIYEKKSVAHKVGCDTKLNIEIREHRVCEVCGASGAELHHWAPFHLFGQECERWPKSHLCVKCHNRWHKIVTPLMSSIASKDEE
jgi:hypothetical protein